MKTGSEAMANWLSSERNRADSLTRRTRKLVIEKRSSFLDLDCTALWEYRELLYALVAREIKVRYKQTAIGVCWVLLQPLVTMSIFTVIFGQLARMPSDGVWYPVFALTGLLPWTYFAEAITRSGGVLVTNANLVTKIYFPRILLPLSMIVAPLLDFALSLILLFCLLMYGGIPITWKVTILPVFILVAMLTALAVSLFVSATNVKYRDVAYAVPFVIQVWMFASPIVYPVSLVPDQWRVLYSLNPMVGVIEGFRWALLGQAAPDPVVMAASAIVFFIILVAGLVYFRRLERDFADVI